MIGRGGGGEEEGVQEAFAARGGLEARRVAPLLASSNMRNMWRICDGGRSRPSSLTRVAISLMMSAIYFG